MSIQVDPDIYNGANIEITPYIGCPLACMYCPQDTLISRYKGEGYEGNRSMSFEEYKLFLGKIPKEVQIIFAGYVEPFTNIKCTKMILHTLEQGYHMSLFTTLQGLEEEDADSILNEFRKRQNQVNIICIHLPDKDMFMRGWKDTDTYFNVLDKFFTYYIERGGISPKLQAMTMDKGGVPHQKIVERYNVRMQGFVANNRADSLNKSKNEVDESVMVDSIKHTFKNRCGATPSNHYNHQVLLPNGDMHICCMDYGLKNKLGNMHEVQRWEDLFFTPEYNRVIELSDLKEYTSELICKSCAEACRV
jgi:hypothetical protein